MTEYTPEEIAEFQKPIVEGGITRHDARTKPHYWIYKQGVDVWNRWGEGKLTNSEKQLIAENIKKYCPLFADIEYPFTPLLPSPNDDSDIDFARTIWYEDVDFKKAIFKQAVYFEDTIFKQDVYFIDAIFEKYSNFIGTVFNKDAHFLKATFEQDVYFFNTTFTHSVIFLGVNFEKFVPFFTGVKIDRNVDFSADGYHFPKYNPKIHDELDISTQYSLLKSFMKKMDFPSKELFFHGKELEAKSYDKANEPKWLLYRLYGLFSDYGQSILRPLKALIITLLASFALYYIHFLCFAGFGSNIINISHSAYSAFYYTFPLIQSDTVLHDLAFELKCICIGATNKGGCAKWFSAIRGVQSIISLFWLFLIGLGLRNNLRMHS
jgi:hypothetical protein